MKNAKKLVPALAMLLVSALMLTTASFAWFVMNADVEATGMNVTIASDSRYLLISSDKTTAAEIQAQKGVEATGTPISGFDKTDLYPVAHNDTVTSDTVGTASSWYTMTGTSTTDGTGTGDQKAVSDLKGYVVKYTYYLTMQAGSPDGSKLRLQDAVEVAASTTNTKDGATDLTPVSVIIVCGDNLIELNEDNSWKETTATTLAETVTDDAATQVDVYVYYDGNNDAVYTNNFSSLANADISFNLVVD